MSDVSITDPDIERKFLVKIYEETLRKKQPTSGNSGDELVSITNVASALGLMTKGSDKQGAFNRIIDSLAEKGLVRRNASSAVVLTPEGIKAVRNGIA